MHKKKIPKWGANFIKRGTAFFLAGIMAVSSIVSSGIPIQNLLNYKNEEKSLIEENSDIVLSGDGWTIVADAETTACIRSSLYWYNGSPDINWQEQDTFTYGGGELHGKHFTSNPLDERILDIDKDFGGVNKILLHAKYFSSGGASSPDSVYWGYHEEDVWFSIDNQSYLTDNTRMDEILIDWINRECPEDSDNPRIQAMRKAYTEGYPELYGLDIYTNTKGDFWARVWGFDNLEELFTAFNEAFMQRQLWNLSINGSPVWCLEPSTQK